MARSSSRSAAVRSLLLLLLASARSSDAKADSSKLSEYRLTIDQLDSIYTSEVSEDFGAPLTKDESESMWSDNTKWIWEENMKDSLMYLGKENTYYSYLLCHNQTDLSGDQRRQKLEEAFEEYKGDIYVGDVVYNADDRSCYLTSSLMDPFENVFDTKPEDVTKSLEVQPAGPSMKMLMGFYRAVKDKMEGETEISAPRDGGTVTLSLTEDDTLGIRVQFCPVVLEAIANRTVDFQDLAGDMYSFMTDENGKNVIARDFFQYAESKYDKTPDQMKFWYHVVKNVTDSASGGGGASECIDDIREDVKIERSTNDTAKVTMEGLEDDDKHDCIWYIVRALALHPYICRMDVEQFVRTLSGSRGPDDSSASDFSAGLGLAISSVISGLALF